MVISYEGTEFFRIQYGDTVLAFNPVSKSSSLKGGRFGADIVLISLNHEDFNGVENVTFGERKPFVISGPGEYELKGVSVRGLSSESNYGGEKRLNTIYLVNIEGMNICFLGALSAVSLAKEVTQYLEDIDILFVPIGGDGLLDSESAYKLVVNLEPKIVIPMHYTSSKKDLDQFLKEAGESGHELFDKLTLKRKDLEDKEGDIMVLKSHE